MRAAASVLAIACLTVGCAGLPELVPNAEPADSAGLMARCRGIQPHRAFRAVHAIDAALPMDQVSSLIGASLVDPEQRRYRAVLMSVEGLTLFDATASPAGLVVHRAVPPLDDPDFGPGLMADVALALLPPAGERPLVGALPDGRSACRYPQADGGVVDLLPAAHDAPTRIDRYDQDHHPIRRVVLGPATGPLGLAGRIVLSAPGLAGYRLELTLLEAEAVTPTDELFTP